MTWSAQSFHAANCGPFNMRPVLCPSSGVVWPGLAQATATAMSQDGSQVSISNRLCLMTPMDASTTGSHEDAGGCQPCASTLGPDASEAAARLDGATQRRHAPPRAEDRFAAPALGARTEERRDPKHAGLDCHRGHEAVHRRGLCRRSLGRERPGCRTGHPTAGTRRGARTAC